MAYLLGFRFSTDRPEIFTYLFLAFVLYVCFFFYKTAKISKLTYLLPIIFLAWPNMHALSIVGLGILAGFVIATFMQKSTKKSKAFKFFAGLCALSAILAIVQFDRFFLFLKIEQVQIFDIKELASLPSRLGEIKYSFLTQIPPEILFYLIAFLCFTIFSCIYIKEKLQQKKYSDVFLTVFFFAVIAAPFKYVRLITACILLAFPWLLEMFQTVFKNKKTQTITASVIIFTSVLLMLLSAMNGFIMGSRNTWQYITNLKNGEIVGVRNHGWLDDYPYKTNNIIKNLNTKRLFTSNPWRNYYLWYFPNIKVPSDIIFEYQTKKGFDNEEKIRFGKENWKELFLKSNVDTVVNSPFESSFANATPVYEIPGWKLIYIDEIANIYAKENTIKNNILNLSKIQPELNTQLKFKPENEKEAVIQLKKLLKYDTNNLFARQQLILDLLEVKKDYKKAADFAWDSYNVTPNYPYFALYLARAHAALGECDEAKTWAEITKNKSFSDVIFQDSLKNALLPCQ